MAYFECLHEVKLIDLIYEGDIKAELFVSNRRNSVNMSPARACR